MITEVVEVSEKSSLAYYAIFWRSLAPMYVLAFLRCQGQREVIQTFAAAKVQQKNDTCKYLCHFF